MKNNKVNYIILILSVVIVSSFTLINAILQQETTEIIGTWVSEEDNNSKWIFSNDNKCKRYYEDTLLNTYNYSISNMSCNNEEDDEYNYLKLVQISNQNKYCYAINGITSDVDGTYLSIEFDGKPQPLLFKKQ